MSIKFNCPKCGNAFSVKDELAGKRAQCHSCKEVIAIPIPKAQPVDVESYAAAALADGPKPEVNIQVMTLVEFTCAFCDEKVKVPSDLAGKQTSCPACKRIVKVPLPNKVDPKDWRNLDTLPSGARRDQIAAPEGTWDTRAAGVVSREALEEANAVPIRQERLSWQQLTKRGVAAAACLVVFLTATWGVRVVLAQIREKKALEQVMAALDAKGKLHSGGSARLRTSLGEYYLRDGNAETALNQLQRARSELQAADNLPPMEREALLIDLLLGQAELGGDRLELENGSRIKWDTVQTQLRQTFQLLRSLDGRSEALRELSRVLIPKGQADRVAALASQSADNMPELLSVVGLEFLNHGQEKAAKELAAKAWQLATTRESPVENQPPAPLEPVPHLIALLLALGKDDKALAMAQPPATGKQVPFPVFLGYVDGFARKGKLDLALQVTKDHPVAVERVPAFMAVSDAATKHDQPDMAKEALQMALELVEPDRARSLSPWVAVRLVRQSRSAGLVEQADRVTRNLADPATRGLAQFEAIRKRLSTQAVPELESLNELVGKDTPFFAAACLVAARAKAACGDFKGLEQNAEAIQPEFLKSFIYLGLVLGLQDSRL